MLPHLERIPAHFQRWVAEHGAAGPCGEVAARLASGELEPTALDSIVAKHGVGREPWFRADVLDMVLGYARVRLSERLLTIDDITDIQLLKRALHVREGEFVTRRPAEISAFIQLVLEAILADERIDQHEELYLVGVQAAFDLSYDQFLSLGRASLERTIATLDFKRAMAERASDGTDLGVIERKRAALAPILWLTSLQRRTLGALY